MPNTLKTQVHHILKVAIALAPWVASLYVLYWLEYGEIWSIETPHRGKISVAILMLGMSLSFFLYSRSFNRK